MASLHNETHTSSSSSTTHTTQTMRPAVKESSRHTSRGGRWENRYPQMGRPSSGSAGQRTIKKQTPHRWSVRKKLLIVLVVLVVLVVGVVGLDFALSNGKVNYGVKVQGIAIGGLTKTEAVAELQEKLNTKFAGITVQTKPDEATAERLVHRAVAGESEELTQKNNNDMSAIVDTSTISWSYSASDLGASVDTARYVDEAYQVGQVSGITSFFPALGQRFASLLGQVDFSVSVDFDTATLSAALKPMSDAVNVQMVNSTIAFDGKSAVLLQPGQIGERVDEATFTQQAQKVLLSETPIQAFTIPLKDIPLDIDDAEAQAVADTVNKAIADPVTFVYETHTWSVDASSLGGWLVPTVEGSGDAAKLLVSVDEAKAYSGLQSIMGEASKGTAQNAHFDVSSGKPVIVGGVPGVGPDITAAVKDLQQVLFGSSAKTRQIVFGTAEVTPAVTAEKAASMGVVDLITTYELGYGSGGGSNREFNIERCLDTLNGSLIAPGSNWNWNEVVGRCDETTGYKDAGAINEKNEIVQEAGGGICNVATGVFNAAYEAGLPVLERANHSQYMANYPLGRDAAVSWQYPTLVFKNDTSHYILITARYNGSTMFISVWGTSPHRTVESKNSEWETTTDGGKSITNYRTVKNADGSLWFEDSFYSYFPPKKS